MSALTNEAFLEQVIRSQRKAIRFYLIFAGGLVLLGVIVLVAAFLSPLWFITGTPIIADVFKGLFGVGGAFVTSLSAFQIKEVLNRMEKIQAFETIKTQMSGLKASPRGKNAETQKRLEELMWKIVEKAALS
ncbi:MAG: hypothetical protein HY869_01410 [Chloroflexi bacterium]|nr:hypothetical protein [Chloroflexota bacterium]